MTDPTAEFFEELERREHVPLLETMTGTLRFDVVDGKRTARWYLTVEKGDLTVSRRGTADCILRGDKAIVERIWSGEVNPLAAVLRGQIDIEGDRKLMVVFQRLLPGPGASSHPRAPVPTGSRS